MAWLKQFPALNPNNRFDEGWYWLDGRILEKDWNLWQLILNQMIMI